MTWCSLDDMLCPGLAEIASFSLMAYGENEHGVLSLFVAIQRHVSRLAT